MGCPGRAPASRPRRTFPGPHPAQLRRDRSCGPRWDGRLRHPLVSLVLGGSPADFIGSRDFGRIHPDDLVEFRAVSKRCRGARGFPANRDPAPAPRRLVAVGRGPDDEPARGADGRCRRPESPRRHRSERRRGGSRAGAGRADRLRAEAARTGVLPGAGILAGRPLQHRRRHDADRRERPRHVHEPGRRIALRLAESPRRSGSRSGTSFASSTRRPGDLVESPVEKVLRGDTPSGPRITGPHRPRREGDPDRRQRGPHHRRTREVAGVVLVFRDVTEKKRPRS